MLIRYSPVDPDFLQDHQELSNQLINKAYHKVADDFSSKRMAARYLDVYKNLLNYEIHH